MWICVGPRDPATKPSPGCLRVAELSDSAASYIKRPRGESHCEKKRFMSRKFPRAVPGPGIALCSAAIGRRGPAQQGDTYIRQSRPGAWRCVHPGRRCGRVCGQFYSLISGLRRGAGRGERRQLLCASHSLTSLLTQAASPIPLVSFVRPVFPSRAIARALPNAPRASSFPPYPPHDHRALPAGCRPCTRQVRATTRRRSGRLRAPAQQRPVVFSGVHPPLPSPPRGDDGGAAASPRRFELWVVGVCCPSRRVLLVALLSSLDAGRRAWPRSVRRGAPCSTSPPTLLSSASPRTQTHVVVVYSSSWRHAWSTSG